MIIVNLSDTKVGYKVEICKADTLLRGRSEGRILHHAIKADRNWEGVRRANFTFLLDLGLLLSVNSVGLNSLM